MSGMCYESFKRSIDMAGAIALGAGVGGGIHSLRADQQQDNCSPLVNPRNDASGEHFLCMNENLAGGISAKCLSGHAFMVKNFRLHCIFNRTQITCSIVIQFGERSDGRRKYSTLRAVFLGHYSPSSYPRPKALPTTIPSSQPLP
ncbi:uncharacterized protein RSE6_05616 [Rhynchosporium secalis]|uniref:Uncharacterized protein n=1 Tax=Rhynchosporium secalis TaxID=38038 RepID=A0A1E1M8B2_RHYSE|nr:uncharacterized protein RSE6_05616 [Rhynchosporium secalis]